MRLGADCDFSPANKNCPNKKHNNLQHEPITDTSVENVPIPISREQEDTFVTTFSSLEKFFTDSNLSFSTGKSTYVHICNMSEFDSQNSPDEEEFGMVEMVNLADTTPFVDEQGDDFNNIDDVDNYDNI